MMIARACKGSSQRKNTGFQAMFKANWKAYALQTTHCGTRLTSRAMYTEKQSIMLVHATPNTQPGGVHGARFSERYQGDCGPSAINQLPSASAPKFRTRKRKSRR